MGERDHAVDFSWHGFEPARHIGFDKSAISGKLRHQLCGGFDGRTACIMLEMPLRRHDVRAEPVELSPVRDQLFVKMARVPVVKDVADIENDGINGPFAGQGPCLALTCLEAAIRLVDDVCTATTADNAAIAMTTLQRFKTVTNFHETGLYVILRVCLKSAGTYWGRATKSRRDVGSSPFLCGEINTI